MKFGRNYRLTVETNSGAPIVIEPPFTVQFNVKRNTMSSLNSMQIAIFNLSKTARDQIFQDRFNPKEYKRIVFQAGYGTLSTIFIGNIFQAHSTRQGADIITMIDARDGGFDTTATLTSRSVTGGSVQDVVRSLVSDFENLEEGTIAGVDGEFRRPVVLDGNTFELIKKYTNDRVFVDLEQVNVLAENQATVGVVPLIKSDTGLLGTPKREDAYLTIDTLFEPQITIGQVLEIQSQVTSVYDGQFKVIGLNHSGVISESVGGDAKSTFNLLVGSQLFGGFNIV